MTITEQLLLPQALTYKVANLPDPISTDPTLISDALDALDANVRARDKGTHLTHTSPPICHPQQHWYPLSPDC